MQPDGETQRTTPSGPEPVAVMPLMGWTTADLADVGRGNATDLRLIMGDTVVRQPRNSRSHKIDMSRAVRPYNCAGAGAARAGRYLDVPLWPWVRPLDGPQHLPRRCPAGHWLAPGQLQETPNQDYGLRELVCRHCENQTAGGGRWALIDPSVDAQVTEAQVQQRRLQLVVVPPPVRAGTGQIQLRWGATIYGQVELSLCAVDRRGLLLGLHIELRHRRRGVGRVLARAAAARGVGFNWSANPPEEADAAAFWARVGAPRAPMLTSESRRPAHRTSLAEMVVAPGD
jgi:hypothetical protein